MNLSETSALEYLIKAPPVCGGNRNGEAYTLAAIPERNR
jgi:hypothetical protein